jgi:hypothetical protein
MYASIPAQSFCLAVTAALAMVLAALTSMPTMA